VQQLCGRPCGALRYSWEIVAELRWFRSSCFLVFQLSERQIGFKCMSLSKLRALLSWNAWSPLTIFPWCRPLAGIPRFYHILTDDDE